MVVGLYLNYHAIMFRLLHPVGVQVRNTLRSICKLGVYMERLSKLLLEVVKDYWKDFIINVFLAF